MGNVAEGNRLWAVSIGQLLGVLLVFSVGILPFIKYGNLPDKTHRDEVNYGLNMIILTGLVVLILSVIAFTVLVIKSKQAQEYRHEHIDCMLWFFVAIDLLGLTFIVCQQGGLSRSMALPAFFLIPAAYLAVVNPSKISSTYLLLIFIGGCVFISFLASYGNISKIPLLPIKVTDLSSLYPKGHNMALLIVCLASLIIPALQLGILELNK